MLLPDDFFGCYWRQQPLHLRGAAAAFLPQPPSRDEVFAAINDGTHAQSDGATVWFIEGATDGFPGFAELVQGARRTFEWHDIWCDVFATKGPSSIGCHYDSSDNFSIQLTGGKKWFLHPPDSLDADDRRRRVLTEPGLGPAPVPESALMFQVQAGDVLYIPSTWIHWGLSDGDSTSVSLVINVATPFHVLQAQIMDSLRQDARWSAPMPAGPGSTRQRVDMLRDLAVTDLSARMRDDVLPRLADRNGSRLSPRHVPLPGRLPEVSADTAALEAYAGNDTDHGADLGDRDGPARVDDEQLGRVAQLIARRNLCRLVRLCEQRAPQTSDADARRIYSAVAACIPALPHAELDCLLTDPDVHSWLLLAERDLRPAGRPRAEDPLAHALGLAMLPELARASARLGPVTVTVGVDEDGCMALRRSGVQLRFGGRPARVSLSGLDGVLCFLGRHREVPIVSGTEVDGLLTGPLPRVGQGSAGRGSVISTATSAWLRRVNGTAPAGTAVHAEAFTRRAAEVAAAMDVSSPFLTWVLIREPANDSCPVVPVIAGMRGLAVIAAREPDSVARALGMARARHEFDSLAELDPLVRDDGNSAAQRAAIRARLADGYVLARAGLSEGRPATAEISQERLTAWGIAVLEAIDGTRLTG
jgi:Cupin superfamily protein